MEVDDSFKKPGAIPFKWEIRPGVPKPQHHESSSSCDEEFSFPVTSRKLPLPLPPPLTASPAVSFRSTPPLRSGSSRSRSFRFYSSNNCTNIVQKQQVGVVSAAGGCFPSPLLIKRIKSEKKKKHKTSKEEITLTTTTVATADDDDDDQEVDYSAISPGSNNSDLDETILSPIAASGTGTATGAGGGRFSVSSRSSCSGSSWKSLSPLRDSPLLLSSSFLSSYRYSPTPPRPLMKVSNDAAEWASFGLF